MANNNRIIAAPAEGQLTIYDTLFANHKFEEAKMAAREQVLFRSNVQLSTNALKVLEKRYLKKDKKGKVEETPEELFRRVAKNIASADKLYDEDYNKSEEEFYQIIGSLEFIPNSPTLMNAGNDLQQLSACFVLPVDDSIDSIFDAIKYTALIHKSGGGTGFSFSRLRPSDDTVCTTHGVSSGPVSFMKVFNSATETIKQGGTRRGANMGILRVDHPNIIDFINCKKTEGNLNNFNISVGLTEKFMRALENDGEYELINPRNNVTVKKLNAREVFDLIVTGAWENGEPGIIFLDRMNQANPTPAIGEIESTNPCGEQPLLPYESCNLGSINLGKMIRYRGGRAEIDWAKLTKTTRIAAHFLDNVIDMNRYPLDKIEKMTKANRKIGLGIMGFADLLFQLETPYDSNEALSLAEKIMSIIRKEAEQESQELAERRGPFPNFEHSVFAGGIPRRNATLTTIAPTGTIGIIANASSGIEPVFALTYTRSNVLDNQEMIETNPWFEYTLKKEGLYTDELLKDVAKKGSIKDRKDIPENIRKVFVTALDISPEAHIRMQAAFQKYTDNAVSKTVNFDNSATKEDIAKAYTLAYKLNCKGVTVYRDGSRQVQVLNIAKDEKKTEPVAAVAEEKKPRLRPIMTTGLTLKMRTGCGNMYVTINEDEQGACEVFTQLGKSGGCTSSQSEAIGRLISLALRSGIGPQQIIEQIKGIRCPSPAFSEGEAILSCADALAKAMDSYIKEKVAPTLFAGETPKNNAVTFKYDNAGAKPKNGNENLGVCPECPDCGSMLVFSEGCAKCPDCGYSRCG